MGREIELKLPLNEQQFMTILNLVCGFENNSEISFELPELIYKSDEYYSQYENHQERLAKEPRVIRIRTEKTLDNFSSCLKNKSFCEIKSWLIQKQNENSGDLKAFFTIKTKQIENALEFNKEYETALDDPDVLREFFKKTNFACWFSKQKIAFGVMVKAVNVEKPQNLQNVENLLFHLELELVNGLPYVEIENTQEDVSAEKVKTGLEDLLKLLNLDKIQKESRSWVEIINEQNKNYGSKND